MISTNLIRKVNFLIYGVALLPLLSLKMVSISIILFVLAAILEFCFSDSTRKVIKKDIYSIFLFSFPFILCLTSLLWTDDMKLGLKIVEKNLSFFIFPICVFVFKIFQDPKVLINFIRVYIISSAISVLLTFMYLFLNAGEILNEKNGYLTNIKIRKAIDDVPIIGEHAIYFSLILALSLLFLLYFSFKNKYINLVLTLIFISGLVVASSKGIILSLVFVLILVIIQSKKGFFNKVLIFLFLGIGLYSLYYVPPINARVNEILKTKNIYPKGIHFNSFNTRVAIYDCGLSLVPQVPFWGFAPAGTQKELDNCYKKFDTSAFDNQKFNTHNQYLDYFLSYGLFGFIVMLYCFFLFFRVSLRSENKMYFNFLVLFCVAFLTENILVRNTGIVLFACFNCIFSFMLENNLLPQKESFK